MSVKNAPWEGYFPPFKIFGNLYFVGTTPASTHIVDTGDGLIMFDSGYQQSLYLVIDNMYSMGLNPHDLKYIFMTHGHIDHFGATRALVELTGAKTVLGEKDYYYATGRYDLSFAKELDMQYNEVFKPDIKINDGDEITLGNTTVKAVATPGHTEGAMSYFFDVTDGEETFRAGREAVKAAVAGETDKMVCYERKAGDAYEIEYKLLPLELAANTEKTVPAEWIINNGTGLSDEYVAYALPLIQGETSAPKVDSLPRFANLKKVLATK